MSSSPAATGTAEETKTLVNDFSIEVATVNGSGSQTANSVLMRTIFQMGVPVSGKNLFPSNIAGLPTWFQIRANAKGYVARKHDVDLMICMNPETAKEDVAKLKPGALVIYDEPLKLNELRSDLVWYPVPFQKLVTASCPEPKLHKLVKNMIYVGVAGQSLGLDMAETKKAITKQLKGKAKAIEINQAAVEAGFQWSAENMPAQDRLKIVRDNKTTGQIIIDGNAACALGAMFAGVQVLAWYPITPASSLSESLIDYAEKYRRDASGKLTFAHVQMEDELASAGAVLGAGWAGVRSMTTTSGPGISLMSEFLGLAYFSELPLVLFNVQRGGPSTGMPTRTQQSDILSCAYASHGDTKHVLLFPANPTECFSMGAEAFNLAERLQTPVIVMSDLDIGMNDWVTDPFVWDDAKAYDRGKVLTAEELENFKQLKGKDWGRYLDVDGDAIPYRTLPGTHPTKGAFFTRGTSHDEYARYTEDGVIHARVIDRIRRKFDTAATLVPKPEIATRDKAGKVGLIYFGATEPAVREALDLLERDGVRVNALRLKAFPFTQEVIDFCKAHETVLVVEQNRDAQMRSLLMTEANIEGHKLVPALNYDGMPLTAAFVCGAVLKTVRPAKQVAAE